MEQLNIKNIFRISSDEVKIKNIQSSVMNILNELFKKELISNFNSQIEEFIGVRGKYEDKVNIVLSFDFNYCVEFKIEVYLYYDQLEYYITKKDKLLKKCNLEDFWEDKIMIEKFIIYLKKDLKKLEIPFNG